MGPAAATIELLLLNWMLAKVGFRPAPVPPTRAMAGEVHGGGVLVHGGSLANLTALLAARSRANPQAWRDGARRDLVLLAPASAHYSNARAAGVMGLGRAGLRELPVDADGRTLASGVAAALDRVASEGKSVLAVIANACCTATGRLRPACGRLREICRARGAWLHVDGAHGASALVSNKLRSRLDGVELAGLNRSGTRTRCCARRRCARRSWCATRRPRPRLRAGGELPVPREGRARVRLPPPHGRVHEGGARPAALLALAAEGEQGAARYVERQTSLAVEAAAILRAAGLEVAVEPESNIVCFRRRATTRSSWSCAACSSRPAASTSPPPRTPAGAGCGSHS